MKEGGHGSHHHPRSWSSPSPRSTPQPSPWGGLARADAGRIAADEIEPRPHARSPTMHPWTLVRSEERTTRARTSSNCSLAAAAPAEAGPRASAGRWPSRSPRLSRGSAAAVAGSTSAWPTTGATWRPRSAASLDYGGMTNDRRHRRGLVGTEDGSTSSGWMGPRARPPGLSGRRWNEPDRSAARSRRPPAATAWASMSSRSSPSSPTASCGIATGTALVARLGVARRAS